jgi:hypothetical protein
MSNVFYKKGFWFYFVTILAWFIQLFTIPYHRWQQKRREQAAKLYMKKHHIK